MKAKLSLVIGLAVGLTAVANTAKKETKETKETYHSTSSMDYTPGGTDGCGLGWQVTKEKTMIATTTRGTTNAFVPPTFGMTSGTFGCEKHSFAQNDMPAATVAQKNLETLKVEMAEGKGETLAAFASSLGCDASAVSSFGAMTQSHYGQFDMASPMTFVKSVRAAIAKDADLKSACLN